MNAGDLVGRMPVVAACAVAGFLTATFPLLLLGSDRPLFSVPVGLVGAVVGARALPGRRGGYGAVGAADEAPWWAMALTAAIVLVFVVLAWRYSSGHVVLRRDAGSYTLFATYLATHGTVHVAVNGQVFGHVPGLQFGSPGFYQVGRPASVLPQFMSGAPMLLAVAGYIAGLTGVLHADAVIGGVALLVLGALTSRIAGARWAPFAVAVAAASYPVLHSARSPYSEPTALILILGGLCLLHDRRYASGGFVAGLTVLVRIDALVDLVPLVIVIGVLALRQPWAARRLAGGLVAGAGIGLVDGLALSYPYLGSIWTNLAQLAVGLVVVVCAVVLTVRYLKSHPRVRPSWWPVVASAAVLVSAAAFWLRAYAQTSRMPGAPWSGMIGQLQVAQHLPLDPTRDYAEQSLHWLSWWWGAPVLVLAVVGLALLARRTATGDAGYLLPFVLTIAAATAELLANPAITPDHPWADRRFVAIVLPGLAICAAYALSRMRPVAMACALAVISLIPVTLATAPLVSAATEQGEPALLSHVCAALPPDAAVLMVGTRARLELVQSVRELCSVPVATVRGAVTPSDIAAIASSAHAHGYRLFVIAEDEKSLSAAGLTPTVRLRLITTEDARTLMTRPSATVPLDVGVLIAPAAGAGAA
jgi:hypothetical protein